MKEMAEVDGVMLYTKRAEQVGLLHSSTSVLYCTLQFYKWVTFEHVQHSMLCGV